MCATTADFSMRGSDAGVVINGVKIRKGRPIHLPCGCSLSFPPYASKYLFQKMNGNWVFLCDLLVRLRLWLYSCIILTTTRIRNLPVNSQQKMLVKRPRFEDNTCDTRCPVIISLPSARYSDDISIFASLLCMEFITRFWPVAPRPLSTLQVPNVRSLLALLVVWEAREKGEKMKGGIFS